MCFTLVSHRLKLLGTYVITGNLAFFSYMYVRLFQVVSYRYFNLIIIIIYIIIIIMIFNFCCNEINERMFSHTLLVAMSS